jgi:hypothetical protein
MPKYRKKPVEIEAMRWDGVNIEDLYRWGGTEAIYDPVNDENSLELLTIDDKWVPCLQGHWVIAEPGPKRRFYPCDPNVFAASYDTV